MAARREDWRLRDGKIRNAFSPNRRVTVDDVIDGAGRRRKDRLWIEGPITMCGGIGSKIYPPRQAKPERPHKKEFRWVTTCTDRGKLCRELMVVKTILLDTRFVKKYAKVLISDEMHSNNYSAVVNNNGTFNWEYRN